MDMPETPVIESVAATLRQVREDAEKAARAWRENFIRNAGVRFRPIWSPRKKVIAVHRTMLDDETGRQTIARLTALASIEDRMDLLFDLDCMILGRATAGLHDLLSRGGCSQLIVPVNFNTLACKEKRLNYLKLCQDIPASFRRFLLFEISNIPAGTPSGRIAELAVPLNSYAHGTFIEAAMDTAKMLLDGAGATIVGVVIHADQFAQSCDPHAKLKNFVTQAIARNLRVLLEGVDSEACLQIGLAAGVDCLAGRAVAETIRTLRTVHHWDLGRAAA